MGECIGSKQGSEMCEGSVKPELGGDPVRKKRGSGIRKSLSGGTRVGKLGCSQFMGKGRGSGERKKESNRNGNMVRAGGGERCVPCLTERK